jgi:uncharacterized protein YggE
MNDRFEFFGNNSIRIAVVGVLAILALFLFAEMLLAIQEVGNPTNPPADTITVQGTGQAALAPDIAHITFTVENTAAQVADAQAATTKQANTAIDDVKGQGVADADITTLSYQITPQYSYSACPSGAYCPASGKVSGYQVAETVQITVRDLEKVDDLLQALGTGQVENVSGPDFGLADPNAGQEAARAKAIEAAKAQAQALAASLGVSLGRIVSFSDNAGGYPFPVYAAAGATAARDASAPEVPAGQNTYTDTVSITYAIR